MEKPTGFALAQLHDHVLKLESDASHIVSEDAMRTYLGRDFSTYQNELANLQQIDPKTQLSRWGQGYAEQALDLMIRITQALNLKHITIDAGETKTQLDRRYGFMSEAEELFQIFESETVYNANRGTPQENLGDAQFLVSYHDAGATAHYSRAYQALEGYPVYLCERTEDSQINQVNTKNQIQLNWLKRLVEEERPTGRSKLLDDYEQRWGNY